MKYQAINAGSEPDAERIEGNPQGSEPNRLRSRLPFTGKKRLDYKSESGEALLELINRAKYDAGAYNALEAFFRAQGYSDLADQVFFAQKRREREEFPGLFRWAWSWFLNLFVRYGRRPQFAFCWSGLVVLLGCFVFRKKGMEPRKPDTKPSHYHNLWYSLDVFVPVIKLQIQDDWVPQAGASVRPTVYLRSQSSGLDLDSHWSCSCDRDHQIDRNQLWGHPIMPNFGTQLWGHPILLLSSTKFTDNDSKRLAVRPFSSTHLSCRLLPRSLHWSASFSPQKPNPHLREEANFGDGRPTLGTSYNPPVKHKLTDNDSKSLAVRPFSSTHLSSRLLPALFPLVGESLTSKPNPHLSVISIRRARVPPIIPYPGCMILSERP